MTRPWWRWWLVRWPRAGPRLQDQLSRGLGLRDGDRMRGARDLERAARASALGQEALEDRGDVAVLLRDQEPRRQLGAKKE
jgi:hypothetical protein